jgi:hypothetical protein
VKLIRTSKDRLLFHLAKREKALLFQLLRLYPRIPAAHQPLSKSGRLPDQVASQRLLEDSLAEQRAENRKKLEKLLAGSSRLVEHETGWRLSLSPAELEWLLQVLNDIRVGSWVILGSPEEWLSAVTTKTAPHLWAMEMAGAFQMEFLEALEEPGLDQ